MQCNLRGSLSWSESLSGSGRECGPSMPAASALQALEALRRRQRACMCQATSWGPYDNISRSSADICAGTRHGLNTISVSQLIEANKKVSSRCIERHVNHRSEDGTFPRDHALMQALESCEVSSLMPRIAGLHHLKPAQRAPA